jgi:hypothetical protein
MHAKLLYVRIESFSILSIFILIYFKKCSVAQTVQRLNCVMVIERWFGKNLECKHFVKFSATYKQYFPRGPNNAVKILRWLRQSKFKTLSIRVKNHNCKIHELTGGGTFDCRKRGRRLDMRVSRLIPRCNWGLGSSEILMFLDWQLVPDVSGETISPIATFEAACCLKKGPLDRSETSVNCNQFRPRDVAQEQRTHGET